VTREGTCSYLNRSWPDLFFEPFSGNMIVETTTYHSFEWTEELSESLWWHNGVRQFVEMSRQKGSR